MADQIANVLVWSEIPAADFDRAKAFYETLFGVPLKEDASGPNRMAMLPFEGAAAAGHIYPGKPAKPGEGITVHFTLPCSLAEAMDRIREGGGEVTSDIVKIDAGSFFYANDTEGNSIGIFKA
ncbi:MAG: VOC family protein [Parvularculaceae bacterium]